MAIVGYRHNFLQGLSDFWQRFFADSDQLAAMYHGQAILMGQAYLDMLSNALSLSLQDTPTFNKEYYKLLLIREDEVRFALGATTPEDRWVYALPDGVVGFASLDNRVIEPTASLEESRDYELGTSLIRLKVDVTDPVHDGVPTLTYARRGVDISTGGKFDDTNRLIPTPGSWINKPNAGPPVAAWTAPAAVYKGDILRILDIGPGLPPGQKKKSDHTIILVREDGLYVDSATPLPTPASGINYVILRTPPDTAVQFEQMTFAPALGIPATATLAHTRIDEGSVRVYAQRGYDGQDVVEGVDYTVDYEKGQIVKIVNLAANPGSLDWMAGSLNKVSYTWKQEVFPSVGGPPPYSTTGKIMSSTATTRVQQLALWAPDAFVDRRLLANNFGSLVGFEDASSENYRAFLRGVFQLYILGPVLERVESALDVLLGLPVVRDDGEVLLNVTTTLTERLVTTSRATYAYPIATPMRTDVLNPANFGTLTFSAFESLTLAVTVTDYVESPDWWHFTTIPSELFAETDDLSIPSLPRRTVSPELIENVIGAGDGPEIGDPDLYIGATEEGLVLPDNATTIDVLSNGQTLPQPIINVVSTVGFPSSGFIVVQTSIGDQTVNYTGLTATTFTGCTGGLGTLSTGGTVTAPHAVFRHRMAFIVMDRFLKFHTFVVRFDPAVLTDSGATGRYIRSLEDLNKLVLGAKPAHTYSFIIPTTTFVDLAIVADERYYQPQRYLGADPDAPELYDSPLDFPDLLQAYVQLGLFLNFTLGSPPGGPDQVLFADDALVIDTDPWNIGDYFHFEEAIVATDFSLIATPVALAGAPAPPRRAILVRVYVDELIGGKALVENIDYTVDYNLRTVTRLTAWDSVNPVNVTYVQANIGNVVDAPPDTSVADMELLIGSSDPSTVRAIYDPAALDWLGVPLPVTDHRDLSLVDRALTIKIT